MTEFQNMFGAIALVVVGYMTVWFLIAILLQRRDVVDSAWGLGFIVAAGTAFGLKNNDSIFSIVAMALVALWGIRLFLHITTRNWKKKEDYRYTNLGALTSWKLWLRTYVNVFLLQGVLMIAISLPVIGIMHASSEPNTAAAIIGCAIWLLGIIFEAIGDLQLRQFLASKQKGIMQSGLWRYTRHPNYFGEVAAWWGAAVVSLSFGAWWGILGAWTITFLILKVSGIPLLEQRYKDNPEFQKYASRTSIFFPLPPRKNRA